MASNMEEESSSNSNEEQAADSVSPDAEKQEDTMVLDQDNQDRIYVHQLNLTSADILRKQKEKEMVQEEKIKLQEMREIKRRQKEEERKRDMEMLMTYNPWGKPGGGNRMDVTKRTKFEETDLPESSIPPPVQDDDEEEPFNQKFGRPGNGAPNRTESGRIRTQLAGDPAIRFQDTQHVRLSIENHLRYKNEDKENYRENLNELIQQKLDLQEQEREWEKKKLEEMKESYPFGRDTKNDSLFMATIPKIREPAKEDFDPWGKGFGNPARDERGNVRRHKFALSAEDGIAESSPPSSTLEMSLGMGRIRGGDGAPHMTESGNVRTRLQNTLNNVNRVTGHMGAHIGDAPVIHEYSYNPWGRPGAGAPFSRENGQPFMEKMGWSLTGHPKKRTRDAKQEYMTTLQQEMNEKKQRDQEERKLVRDGIVLERHIRGKTERVPGKELATVIRQGVGGRPKKNPVTGELVRNPRLTSDVTAQKLDIRRVRSQESLIYHNQLSQQAAERQHQKQKQREVEKAQTEQHVQTWDSFWGRPGHGAPRDPENHKKENINCLLLNPEGGGQPYVKHYTAEMVPSKHKNRYEFSTKDTENVIKKDYEFRTPWPAAEA